MSKKRVKPRIKTKIKSSNPNSYRKTTFLESPDFIINAYGVLMVYTTSKATYSRDLINPSFDPTNFDIYEPHTVSDWQSCFFASNPDSELVDKLLEIEVLRLNAHTSAFYVYLQKKNR